MCCIFGRKLETDSALKRLRQSTLKTIQEYIQKLDPAAELTKIVVDVMPRLIGVVKLEISTCSYCEISFISGELEFHKSKQSNLLIHHVWNIFKARLYQVEINCPIELVTHLQLPTSSHFSSLENFSFRTFSLLVPHLTYNPPHAEDLSQTVVPFLKGHQSTLRDVSLTISAFLIDTSLIFQGLQGMSSLKSLEISLPFLSLSKTPFHGYPLLIAHSHSLKSLSLIFGIYPETSFQGPPFFSQDWCLVDLPHLTNLTLAPPRVPFCPSFTNYVYRFSTSLVSLTILYDPELTHSDIKEFCKTLVEFQSLRCLDLSVLGFSPTILAEFASALPRLRSLILNYRIICPYQNQDSLGTSLQNVVSWPILAPLYTLNLYAVFARIEGARYPLLAMGIRVIGVSAQCLCTPATPCCIFNFLVGDTRYVGRILTYLTKGWPCWTRSVCKEKT